MMKPIGRIVALALCMALALASCAFAEPLAGYTLTMDDMTMSIDGGEPIEVGLTAVLAACADLDTGAIRMQGGLEADGRTVARGEAAYDGGAWLLWAEGLPNAYSVPDGEVQDEIAAQARTVELYARYMIKLMDAEVASSLNEALIRGLVEEGLFVPAGEEWVEVLGERRELTRYDFQMSAGDRDRETEILRRLDPDYDAYMQALCAAPDEDGAVCEPGEYYTQRYAKPYAGYEYAGSYWVDETFTLDRLDVVEAFVTERGAVDAVEYRPSRVQTRVVGSTFDLSIEDALKNDGEDSESALKLHVSREPALTGWFESSAKARSDYGMGMWTYSAQEIDGAFDESGAHRLSLTSSVEWSDGYLSESELRYTGDQEDGALRGALHIAEQSRMGKEDPSGSAFDCTLAISPASLDERDLEMSGLDALDVTRMSDDETKALERQQAQLTMTVMGRLLQTKGVAQMISRWTRIGQQQLDAWLQESQGRSTLNT